MLMLGLGLAALAALFWAMRGFSRATVGTVKALLAWVLALAGISLLAMLVLTGRVGAALSVLVVFGPLVWSWWVQHGGAGPSLGKGWGFGPRPPGRAGPGAMSRAEALEVLGLADPVTEAEVRAAWVRLMRVAHSDSGGSDWLGARINQARDVLLGRR